jgi:hypothetical protein
MSASPVRSNKFRDPHEASRIHRTSEAAIGQTAHRQKPSMLWIQRLVLELHHPVFDLVDQAGGMSHSRSGLPSSIHSNREICWSPMLSSTRSSALPKAPSWTGLALDYRCPLRRAVRNRSTILMGAPPALSAPARLLDDPSGFGSPVRRSCPGLVCGAQERTCLQPFCFPTVAIRQIAGMLISSRPLSSGRGEVRPAGSRWQASSRAA